MHKDFIWFLLVFSMLELYSIAEVPLTHKIVFLVTIPRSMSTAALRAMHNRGDFIVVNEPAVATFFGLSDEGTGDDWEFQKDLSQLTYRDIIDHIIELSTQGHVFVKEMGFVAQEYLCDSGLINNPHVYFIFLVRNPHDVIVSYYTVRKGKPLSNDLSYQTLLDLFYKINERATNKPIIIKSEELASQPYETMKHICAYVGIPVIESSLHWEDISHEVASRPVWHMTPDCLFNKEWQLNTLKSTGFHALTSNACDANNNPTFEELNPVFYEECKKLLAEQQPYYQKLISIKGSI